MHPASTSIKYFGLYIVVTGAGLLLAPGPLLAPLGIPAPTEVWIRVAGALALVVGYYYWVCGKANAVDFFRASVQGRIAFAGMMILLILLFSAPVQLLLFAVIDVAGAAWTARGLRQQSTNPTVAAR